MQWMLLSAPDEIRPRADRILTQLVAERLDPTSTSRTLIGCLLPGAGWPVSLG